MSVSFTTEQQKVIDTRNCSMLVSAAAGSGKTAVLTERILKLVSDENHPADIDRLLVVTFTRAAAAEMKERISMAIEKELAANPENEHLQRQSALLYNAQITTIDSFCLFVIRNHFHTIGLDPGFRTMDEGERKLLLQDVLSEVLEKYYKQGDEAFVRCMEYFGSGSSDKAVEDMVLRLYEYAMSHPFPKDWLKERMGDYAWPEEEAKERLNSDARSEEEAKEQPYEAPWLKEAMMQVKNRLLELGERIRQCIKISEEPDGPYMYGGILEQEAEQIDRLLAAKGYEAGQAAFAGISFGRLPSKKDETVSVQKRELVKAIRADIKAQLQDIAERYFAFGKEVMKRQMSVCREAAGALITLTISFLDAFDEAKREKNLLDFGDMEHLALSILCEKGKDGRILPTPTALEYRSHFEEILIDEYQDSNLVQEYLLSVISGEEDGRYNRFMVGDVKQSIYRFRLARPELFLEKYDTFSGEEGSATLRIDLHQNFRSRAEILISTNAVFEQVMQPALGGITYDEKAALHPGAVYCEQEGMYDTELLLFTEAENENGKTAGAQQFNVQGADVQAPGGRNTDARTKTDVKELEAYGIAARIRELIQSFQVTDKETGKLRLASYKDIVILLRTTSGWDETFKKILEEEGIPVHVTSKTGYFETSEVQELLHYLRILDNPLQDIPLYGVLHSYLGGFTEEEIALVRAASPKTAYLYDALCAFVGMEEATHSLAEKIKIFLQKLESYRDMAVYLSVHELLRQILSDSEYLSYVAAKPGGARRRANVEMLLTQASDYEKTSYYGLYHFLRYIEQLEKYDVDYGEANLMDENADVVRIMSIHKSKGLEFPVCFVSGLSKNFNRQDEREKLILDADWGIGIDYVDTEKRIKSKTLRRNFLSAKLKQDNLAEELRVLYVAMTRAKEKLILTGVLRQPEKKLSSLWLLTKQSEPVLSAGYMLQTGSFLDILLSAAARNQCFDRIWEQYGFETDSVNPVYEMDMKINPVIHSEEEVLGKRIKQTILREEAKHRLLYREEMQDFDNELMTIMSDRFSYRYPYDNLKDLYTKTTVSELKKAGIQEETDFSFSLYEQEQVVPYLPKFLQSDEGISGTDRGSAYHKVMELFDFALLTDMVNIESLPNLVKDSMQKMLKEGRLSKLYYEAVSVSKLVQFLQSDVAKRMAKAAASGKLYREQPFVLGLCARRLNDAFPEEETVLIQGIIDVFFEEDGNYVLLDYKTDAVKTPEELAKRYQVQLDYYEEALLQLSVDPATGKGKQVKEKLLYSFGLGREIRL